MPIGSDGVFPNTITVGDLGLLISGLRVQTFILHEFPGYLNIYLQTPNGTAIPLSISEGRRLEHVFYGTLWDDHALNNASTYRFIFDVTAPVVRPWENLSILDGESTEGNWTLIIEDTGSLAPDSMLHRWMIDFARMMFLFCFSFFLSSF
jgi:subtilisin-like proprotein convertase family protein